MGCRHLMLRKLKNISDINKTYKVDANGEEKIKKERKKRTSMVRNGLGGVKLQSVV